MNNASRESFQGQHTNQHTCTCDVKFPIGQRTGSSRLFGGTKNTDNMPNIASRKLSCIPKVIYAAGNATIKTRRLLKYI